MSFGTMYRCIRWFLFYSVFSFLVVPNVFAATYYVHPDGDDAADGLSPATAWRTVSRVITHDISTTFLPGDEIRFARSGRWYEPLTITSSGSTNNPLLISAYGTGALPILSAAERRTIFASLDSIESSDGLFSTGFEFATTSNFNSATISTGNTLIVSSSTAHQGRFALETVFNGDISQKSARVNRTISNSPDVYARVYFYFPNDFSILNTDQRVDILMLKQDASVNRVRVSVLQNASGDLYLQGRIETPSVSNFYIGTPGEVQKGTWHAIEVRYKGDDGTNGGAELWLNGNSLGSNYTTNTTGLTIGRVEVGANSSSQSVPSLGSKIFIDNLKIATSSVGLFSPQGSSNIYLTEGVNWIIRQMIVNGNQIFSADSFASLSPGTFFRDTSNNNLYIRLQNDEDPNLQIIELTRHNSPLLISNASDVHIESIQVEGNNTSLFGGITCNNSDRVFVQDIISTKNFGAGIMMDNGCDYMTVQKSQLLSNARTFGGAVRIQNNSHHNIIEQNILSGLVNGTRFSNGVYISGLIAPSEQNIIRYNIIRDMSDSAVYVNSNANYNYIYGNVIYGIDDRDAGALGGNGIHIGNDVSSPVYANNNQIYNNLIYDVATHGISLREGSFENLVYNNTVYNVGINRGAVSGNVASGSGINLHSTSNTIETGSARNRVFNNIVSTCATVCLNVDVWSFAAGGNEFNNNLYHNPLGTLVRYNGISYTNITDYQLASSQDTASLQADPRFVNVAEANFSLLADSPAIDSGTSTLGSSYRLGFTAGSNLPDVLALADQNDSGEGWDIGAFVYNFIVTVIETIKRSSGVIVAGVVPDDKAAGVDQELREGLDTEEMIIPGMTQSQFRAIWNQVVELEKMIFDYLSTQYTLRYQNVFTRSLKEGDVGLDVFALQQFLNRNDFIISIVGAGSSGNETLYFGSGTTAALRQFQIENKLPETGQFDEVTRSLIIEHSVDASVSRKKLTTLKNQD
jgi:peptidoglycan hydrolase-like protein with peptidoglycan-binding domain